MLSFAARGLWFDMLCIMSEADPRGYLVVRDGLSPRLTPPLTGGLRAITNPQLARILGGSVDEIDGLIREIEEAGVSSRDDRGLIFSRRIVRDEHVRQCNRINGRKGGNPKLVSDNPPDKAPVIPPGYPPPYGPPKMKMKMKNEESGNGDSAERGKGVSTESSVGHNFDPNSENPVLRLEGWELSGLGILDTPDIRAALAEWVLDLRERDKPPTGRQWRAQVGRLNKMGPERALAAIHLSLAQGWAGIHEDKANGESAQPRRDRTPKVYG